MSDFWTSQRKLHKELSQKKETHEPTSLFTYKTLAEQAYKKNPLKTVEKDWSLILSSKNNKVYQNRITGEVTNNISGSKSGTDFINDGLQYLGFLNNPLQRKRYQETDDIVQRLNAIQRKRPITTTSHSLGSQMANKLIDEDKVDKAINFNPFIPDKSLNLTDKRILNVRNNNDFASTLTKNNENTINLNNNSNPIKSHFLSEVKL